MFLNVLTCERVNVLVFFECVNLIKVKGKN